jgi:acetyltransferase-like isoleucine patch superfamily enzyme
VLNDFLKLLYRITDPNTYISAHRRIFIRNFCKAGHGLKVTHRAEIFHHGVNRRQITLGCFVTLDGTLEVYKTGVITIGDYSFIGRSRIYSANHISIGHHCLVSDNVCVMDSSLHPISASKRANITQRWSEGEFPDVYTDTPNAAIILEDHCWIGSGCTILKGVRVGEGAIVGAGSVVTKDVLPWTIVAGNPARFIREIPESER